MEKKTGKDLEEYMNKYRMEGKGVEDLVQNMNKERKGEKI